MSQQFQQISVTGFWSEGSCRPWGRGASGVGLLFWTILVIAPLVFVVLRLGAHARSKNSSSQHRELLGNIVETRFTIVIAAEDGD